MIFNTLKHMLGLEFHQGTDILVTETDRQTDRHTTRLPMPSFVHAPRGIMKQNAAQA